MRVYHLLSAEFAVSDIALQHIKIARYADMNDPFELIAAELGDPEMRAIFERWNRKMTDNLGVVCFSMNWHNPVLWSHYGDKHKGICLGFDIPDEHATRIDYVDARIPPRFLVDGDRNSGPHPDFSDAIRRSKFRHWQYEQEVRITVDLAQKGIRAETYFLQFTPTMALKQVILGARCDASLESITALVARMAPTAEIIRARLAFETFEVVAD